MPRLPLLVLAVLVLPACRQGADRPAEPAPGDAVVTVRGVFVGPALGGEAAVIEHEAIPGQMDAMRMTFRLEDPALIAGLAPGTPIAFDYATPAGAAPGITRVAPLPPGTPLVLDDSTALSLGDPAAAP